MRIDFKKYKVDYPKDPKPNSKHYRKMIKKIRKELPRVNGT
jgi:hypothetical protein